MTTKTKEKATTKKVVSTTPSQEKKESKKTATPQKNGATAKTAMQKIDAVLKPSGKSIVKRLQHAQILAEKFEKMSTKYDDLTHFMAGKDNDNSTMKFASAENYSFTLNNPAVINKVLEVIENEFSNHLEKAENELLNFSI
tara:strand:- start:208 stop:630 length:423 start_codon:yes stop_codon:yes gene_type:complete